MKTKNFVNLVDKLQERLEFMITIHNHPLQLITLMEILEQDIPTTTTITEKFHNLMLERMRDDIDYYLREHEKIL